MAKPLLSIILQDRREGQWYVEPFAGGMNTICEVSGPRLANDCNYYLIEMWKTLLDGWVPPIITRQEYNHIRDNKQSYPPYLVGWVGFNCSYSGKWFAGFAGTVKTKVGTIRDYQSEAIRNVLPQVNKMIGTELHSVDYQQLPIPENSIVYCDPPYQGTTKYFEDFNHADFWEWVRNISGEHSVFVSEYCAPDDFQVVLEIPLKSSLSANGVFGGSKSSVERLFKYRG